MGRLVAFIAFGAITGATGVASAGFLATDPTAMPAWRGTQAFTSAALNVNVDFAVYAPGAYGAGDPSGGTRYVYAYQGFNVGTRAFSNLTVGLLSSLIAFDGGFDFGKPTLGGVIPLFTDSAAGSGFPATSFRSIFQAAGGPFTKVNPGQWSQVVLFTSPFAPIMYSSSVIDEGEQVQRVLPSPAIPAPAAASAFVIGGLAMARRRRSN